jgi:hypothetical protein
VPGAPIAPKDPRECDAFAQEFKALIDRLTTEHQQCLDANSKSPENPASHTNILICSHSPCQTLHDYVYGDFKKAGNAEIDACRAAANDYQARLARERQLLAARQEALQGATTSITAALQTLLNKDTAQPLNSQSQLSDYDAQKQQQAVVGDDADASLKMNDDVANLAANKDKGTAQDTLGQDLNKLGGTPDQPVPTDECASALKYVSDPTNGLQADLERALNTYAVEKEGLKAQQDLKAQLLNDSWWATSSGPVVAARIKYYADELQDWVSVFLPAEAELNQAKQALLDGLKLSGAVIKGAYQNSESLMDAIKGANDEAAKELAEIGKDKLGQELGAGQVYSAYKIFKDQADFVETLDQAAEARNVVQDQIHKLDDQIAKARTRASIAAEKATALDALRQDVLQACTQKVIIVTPP